MSRRLRLLRVWTLLSVFVLFAANVFAQTITEKEVSLPEELSNQVEKDFELPDCFEEGAPSIEDQVTTKEVNLTTSTSRILLVAGRGTCLTAGTSNAPYIVYSRFGNNWRKILRVDGEALHPLAYMYNGWHDIEVLYRNSESQVTRYVYRFSKTEYRGITCEVLLYSGKPDTPEHKSCPDWKSE